MNDEIRIRNHGIGASHPAFLVAEAGSNHNRNLDLAHQLIQSAAEAGGRSGGYRC